MEWIIRDCLNRATAPYNFDPSFRKWFIQRIVQWIDYYERKGFYLEKWIFVRPNFFFICEAITDVVPLAHDGNRCTHKECMLHVQHYKIPLSFQQRQRIAILGPQTLNDFFGFNFGIFWKRDLVKASKCYIPKKYKIRNKKKDEI